MSPGLLKVYHIRHAMSCMIRKLVVDGSIGARRVMIAIGIIKEVGENLGLGRSFDDDRPRDLDRSSSIEPSSESTGRRSTGRACMARELEKGIIPRPSKDRFDCEEAAELCSGNHYVEIFHPVGFK